jgi:hypothetical protein
MSQPHSVLLQHDIMDQVLSYCDVPYYWGYRSRDERPSVGLRVGRDAAWLATAMRTCKAWLEPSLRHLYRTVYIYAVQVDADICKRIGHRVRTLVIQLEEEPPVEQEPDVDFNHFTRLSTLTINSRYDLPLSFVSKILSCPSLANLADLSLIGPRQSGPLVALIRTCKSLRRLAFDTWKAEADGLSGALARPERLEEFHFLGKQKFHDGALAPLYGTAYLVTLNIANVRLERNNNFHLVHQAIKASSRTLLAISLRFIGSYHDRKQILEWKVNGASDNAGLALPLIEALSSCTSLRFLRIGHPILQSVTLRKLFKLLSHLSIELISFDRMYHVTRSNFEWFRDSLHLLSNLSVLMVCIKPHDLSYVKPKLDSLVTVTREMGRESWPPAYGKLPLKAQAIFTDRPYRTYFFSA